MTVPSLFWPSLSKQDPSKLQVLQEESVHDRCSGMGYTKGSRWDCKWRDQSTLALLHSYSSGPSHWACQKHEELVCTHHRAATNSFGEKFSEELISSPNSNPGNPVFNNFGQRFGLLSKFCGLFFFGIRCFDLHIVICNIYNINLIWWFKTVLRFYTACNNYVIFSWGMIQTSAFLDEVCRYCSWRFSNFDSFQQIPSSNLNIQAASHKYHT